MKKSLFAIFFVISFFVACTNVPAPASESVLKTMDLGRGVADHLACDDTGCLVERISSLGHIATVFNHDGETLAYDAVLPKTETGINQIVASTNGGYYVRSTTVGGQAIISKLDSFGNVTFQREQFVSWIGTGVPFDKAGYVFNNMLCLANIDHDELFLPDTACVLFSAEAGLTVGGVYGIAQVGAMFAIGFEQRAALENAKKLSIALYQPGAIKFANIATFIADTQPFAKIIDIFPVNGNFEVLWQDDAEEKFLTRVSPDAVTGITRSLANIPNLTHLDNGLFASTYADNGFAGIDFLDSDLQIIKSVEIEWQGDTALFSPQIARAGDEAIVAWTEAYFAGDTTTIPVENIFSRAAVVALPPYLQ